MCVGASWQVPAVLAPPFCLLAFVGCCPELSGPAAGRFGLITMLLGRSAVCDTECQLLRAVHRCRAAFAPGSWGPASGHAGVPPSRSHFFSHCPCLWLRLFYKCHLNLKKKKCPPKKCPYISWDVWGVGRKVGYVGYKEAENCFSLASYMRKEKGRMSSCIWLHLRSPPAFWDLSHEKLTVLSHVSSELSQQQRLMWPWAIIVMGEKSLSIHCDWIVLHSPHQPTCPSPNSQHLRRPLYLEIRLMKGSFI